MRKSPLQLTRRQLLRAGAALAGGLPLQKALAEPNGSQFTMAGYMGSNFGNVDGGCLDWMIVGVFVVYGEVFFVLANYSPTALLEVTKAPGDSIFWDMGDETTGNVVGGIKGFRTEGGMEVRCWEILEDMRELMFEGYYECICKPKPVPGQSSQGQGQGQGSGQDTGGMGDQYQSENEDSDACQWASQIIEGAVSEVIGQIDVEFGDYLKLVYDSGIDAVNWRTGCRDIGTAFQQGFKILKECAMGLRDDQNLDWNSDPVCVGDWGPLMPRQMRADGASFPVTAAHLAYRALHIAAKETGRFQYEVSLRCKMQPVYPKLEYLKCFSPGCSVHEVDGKVESEDNSKTKYGFVWWTQTGCVKSAEQLEDCLGS